MLLTNSDLSSHTINQFLGIVADPGLKHRLDVLDLVNSFCGIAFDQNEVRLFASREGSNSILLAEIYGAILRGDPNRLYWSEACFHEQLYFALIAETRQYATVSSGITSKSISLRRSAVLGESKGTLARAVR
jgi:hypothetical protein